MAHGTAPTARMPKEGCLRRYLLLGEKKKALLIALATIALFWTVSRLMSSSAPPAIPTALTEGARARARVRSCAVGRRVQHSGGGSGLYVCMVS